MQESFTAHAGLVLPFFGAMLGTGALFVIRWISLKLWGSARTNEKSRKRAKVTGDKRRLKLSTKIEKAEEVNLPGEVRSIYAEENHAPYYERVTIPELGIDMSIAFEEWYVIEHDAAYQWEAPQGQGDDLEHHARSEKYLRERLEQVVDGDNVYYKRVPAPLVRRPDWDIDLRNATASAPATTAADAS